MNRQETRDEIVAGRGKLTPDAFLDALTGFSPDFGIIGNLTAAQMYECIERLIGQRARWLPISEAPKDGTRVLLYSPDDGLIAAEWWESDSEQDLKPGWWGATGCPVDSGPTHWMPLPEPPDA